MKFETMRFSNEYVSVEHQVCPYCKHHSKYIQMHITLKHPDKVKRCLTCKQIIREKELK